MKDLEKKNKKLEDEKDLMSLDVDARYSRYENMPMLYTSIFHSCKKKR